MGIKKTQVRVVKQPLDKTNILDNEANFPRMPTMYLELIENKSKVKRDVVNEEFKPLEINSMSPPSNTHVSDNEDRVSEHSPVRDINVDTYDPDVENQVASSDPPLWLNETDGLYEPHNSIDSHDKNSISMQKPVSVDSFRSDVFKENVYISAESKNTPVYDKISVQDNLSVKSSKSSISSNLSKRLMNLLSDSKSSKKPIPVPLNTLPVKPKTVTQTKTSNVQVVPPTLSELEKTGQIKLKKEPAVVNNTAELKKTIKAESMDEEDKKRELLFKFELLKQSYKNSTISIPEFTMYSDYIQMKNVYESTVRRLSLNGSVEQYKTYLIGGFMVCEFVFGNFMKLDMSGFTQQQIMSMHNYDKLLVELGEKSYVPDQSSKWSVEIRLLSMILMNAAFFIVSKLIMQKTGSNLMNTFNNFTSKNMNMNTDAAKPQVTSKRKMKGPEINLDEI
jgi:hypothetical protein